MHKEQKMDGIKNKKIILTGNGMKILKTVHLLCAAAWFGGAFSLAVLNTVLPKNIDAAYGINIAIHAVDMTVVVYIGAIGCFLTGLIYGFFSGWGFFRFRWISVKWVITVSIIIFGTFFLGKWEEEMLYISAAGDFDKSATSRYMTLLKSFKYGGLFNIAMLVAAFIISVFKPWKKNHK